MGIKYKYKALEDYLISTPLTVDGTLDDGWGAVFPVKGVEIEATILFADISAFSRRTRDMSPTESLIYVNNYFSWITAEAIMHRPCIVDKYIGDEVMVLFAKEFGSEDHFIDAIQTARWMSERDFLNFCPHIGIASGLVTVGYVGTPVKYNASVFGLPVTLANRCTSIRADGVYSTSIVFPADLWSNYEFDEVFNPEEIVTHDKNIIKQPHNWRIQEKRAVSIKTWGSWK